jgi:hypothetical protein
MLRRSQEFGLIFRTGRTVYSTASKYDNGLSALGVAPTWRVYGLDAIGQRPAMTAFSALRRRRRHNNGHERHRPRQKLSEPLACTDRRRASGFNVSAQCAFPVYQNVSKSPYRAHAKHTLSRVAQERLKHTDHCFLSTRRRRRQTSDQYRRRWILRDWIPRRTNWRRTDHE